MKVPQPKFNKGGHDSKSKSIAEPDFGNGGSFPSRVMSKNSKPLGAKKK